MSNRTTKPENADSPSVGLSDLLDNADLLERCSEAVHKAYCDYHLKNKGVEYWTKGDYSLLDEPTKQIDRETVKAVFDVLRHG